MAEVVSCFSRKLWK